MELLPVSISKLYVGSNGFLGEGRRSCFYRLCKRSNYSCLAKVMAKLTANVNILASGFRSSFVFVTVIASAVVVVIGFLFSLYHLQFLLQILLLFP
jgi:hypothetical protein